MASPTGMPPPTCPQCQTQLPSPIPPSCPSCGEGLLRPVPDSSPGLRTSGIRGAHLSGNLPDGKWVTFPLGPRTTLGRHPGNDIRLSDREVSKEHAAIERNGATFVLRDLGSSNGTFVNGRRIRELKLREGDELVLGNCRLVFHGGDGERPSSPRVTVVASGQSIPAFLAQIDQSEESEFRPADQLNDFNSLRQDYEKLRIAHELHRQVGLERNPKNLLDKVLQVAFQLLPADNGVVFLVNQSNGELIPHAVKHRRSDSSEVILSETVLQRVRDTRQAVLTADAIVDSRFASSESIVAQGIRSAMAVPLLTKGVVKGILFLDTRERTHAFSEKDLKILSGIALQAAIALENAELASQIESEALTRAELSRFLSPAIAEMVVRGQVELLRAGRLAEVSVLFADIRGFTTLAESETPQETVSMLNAFFTAMAKVIFRNEGNLDKFIGDCVMAVWGSPSSHPDDPARALRAALEMQAEMEGLNQQRVASGRQPIAIGIGVNTGQAVVGYMGSSERHEYTAIGDSVNTAARLCSLAKGGEVLASEAAIERAGGGFNAEALPIAQVRGKEKGVAIYRVTA